MAYCFSGDIIILTVYIAPSDKDEGSEGVVLNWKFNPLVASSVSRGGERLKLKNSDLIYTGTI